MIDLFKSELEAVHGELIACSSIEEAKIKLADLLKEQEATSIVTGDSELAVDLCSAVAGVSSALSMTKEDISEASHSVLEASLLFAETGSCLVHNKTRAERFACYLPEKCVVIAKASGVTKSIVEGWGKLAEHASTATSGESVILTGPSRTADIEKILIVGAHGPKKLTVLLLGNL